MNLPAISFMIVTITLTEGINYKIRSEKSITEESTILKMFPSEELWSNAEMSSEKRSFFESSFSKASYKRECEHEPILIPIYYYSGETVSIECFMCNIALVLNGSPKGWARAKNIDNFFEKGNKFETKENPGVEIVQNSHESENQTMNPTIRKLGEPYYHQSNGFLIITEANVYSQGVYFCYDEDSVASQRYFYILIPILPMFHMSKQNVNIIKKITNGCSDSSRSFPNHYWKESNSAEIFDDQETCFTRNGFDDWSCYDYRKSIRLPGCGNPASSCRSVFSSSTLPMEIPISITLQWSSWSECENHHQKRIGQCFFSLDRMLTESDALTKKWDWLWKLNRMTSNLAFREGLPLFNGLLASWLYGIDELNTCLDSELNEKGNIDRYDTFFSDVLNSVSMNSTIKYETLQSAFKYCFKYEKLENYEVIQGTYTEDQRTC